MHQGKLDLNGFLSTDVDLYFHDHYYGMNSEKNTLKYINYLKNDSHDFTDKILDCENKAAEVLSADLRELVLKYGPLTVCGIPRSRCESFYDETQMGLKRAIRKAIKSCYGLTDGLDYIVRHTDTVCTHRSYFGTCGNGEHPRPGLIQDTCTLSPEIAGKNIVLIDDIYTRGVGIDEDGAQALLNMGANKVIMYTFGCTANKGYRQ